MWRHYQSISNHFQNIVGYRGGSPTAVQVGKPALCGSCPLVTPYYCRLGDLLCFVFMSAYCMFDLSVYYLFLRYFDTVGSIFWPVKTVSHNLYCVDGDVKHCSIQSNSKYCITRDCPNNTSFLSRDSKHHNNPVYVGILLSCEWMTRVCKYWICKR